MKAFVLLITLFSYTALSAQQKRALIIAIGKYPEASRIRPIAAVNDIPFIKAALYRNDFPSKNIDTLLNEKATKAGILKALTGLRDKSMVGDIIVIHFSCHGQQIRDQRTVALGKDEDDGYDEALVPYDARSQYDPTGYKGENHLRDDDLDPILSAIRKKIGRSGSLLVLLDACHSGTATRANEFAVSRGEPLPFADPENPMESIVRVDENDASALFFKQNKDSLANMVVISGTGPHQLNYQLRVNSQDVGSLSYSFYKAMQELPQGGSYRLLYEKIRAIIQADVPEQLPIAEGDLDQVVFSGRFADEQEQLFIRVGLPKRTGDNDTLFTFNKGLMDNIAAGNSGKIFISGTDTWVADAIVRQSANFVSTGVASQPLKKSVSYEIRMDEKSFGDFSAVLKIAANEKDGDVKRLAGQVRQWIKPYQFISLGNQADFSMDISKANRVQHTAITDLNNRIIWQINLPAGDSMKSSDRHAMLASIKAAMRLRYIRNIPDGGVLNKSVRLSLQPVESGTAPGASAGTSAEALAVPELQAGDHYYIRMENKTNRKIFYSVIDILPDNTMEILYPYKDKDASNYSIEPGKQVVRELAVSREPQKGKELIKVFFTREPMDLRAVFARRKERANENSFQSMLDDLFKDDESKNSTRDDVQSVKVEEIGIISTGFIVK